MAEEKKEVRDILFENATLWIPSTTAWSGTDKLTAKDLDKEPEDVLGIFRLGRKALLPDEWHVRLGSSRSKITALMTKVGLQSFIRGAWVVPDKNLLFAKEGMARIQEEQALIVEEFINAFPVIKEEMIAKAREYLGREPIDDNEADACLLGLYAWKEYGTPERDKE